MVMLQEDDDVQEDNQMLEFEPEDVEDLQRRVYKALVIEYTMPMIRAGDRPGRKRENVFDFNTGVRLIVSIDKPSGEFEGKPAVLHISGSMRISTDELFADGVLSIDPNRLAMKTLWEPIRGLIALLCEFTGGLQAVCTSNGIMQWLGSPRLLADLRVQSKRWSTL